jgi:hypothetical protein
MLVVYLDKVDGGSLEWHKIWSEILIGERLTCFPWPNKFGGLEVKDATYLKQDAELIDKLKLRDEWFNLERFNNRAEAEAL